MEKENSATLQVYYKGFSIMLTDRGHGTDITNMYQSFVDFIKEHEHDENLRPSWNLQTAKEVSGKTDPTDDFKPTKNCEIHNRVMYQYAKNGKTWFSHKTEDGSYCSGVRKAYPAQIDI